MTIALERHDVVHVHTDDADRSVCIRGGGEGRERTWRRWRRREDERKTKRANAA